MQNHALCRRNFPRRGYKLLLAMKLTILLLLAFSFQVSANIHAQERVSLALKNASLGTVLKAISKQTSYQYILPEQFSQVANPVDITVTNASLDDALAICFSNQPFTFTIVKKIIVVKEKEKVRQTAEASPQVKNINAKGIVYNEAGQPLSGANVTIKETGKGVITNATGEYEFTGIPSTSTLVISFIGYAPQAIKVAEDKVTQVYLKVAKNELDKVVVQAYGTTTQRLNTGNIATVTAAEIERQPVMNVLTSLQGKVPGLDIQQTSGYASAPYKVEIRGRSQLNGTYPSEPLYIIDGVPLTILELNGGNYASGSTGFAQNGLTGPAGGQSPIFSLDPNDIESISVLKDADATAIYGSRGANGVIIITTKKGKAGKTKLDFSGYEGESRVTKRYNLLNTQQYLAMRHEAFKNDGITPDLGNAYDLLLWDTTRYTDFQDYFWNGVGKTTHTQLSFSGGDKQTTFRIGGSYHKETDITTISGANERASVQFNLSHKSLNQRLNISVTSTYSYTNVNIISLNSSVLLAPDASSVYASGKEDKLNWTGWAPIDNPFGNLLQPYAAASGFLNSELSLKYEIFKGLMFSTNLGYSTSTMKQIYINPISSQNPAYNPTGSSSFGNNSNTNIIVEPNLEYQTYLGKGKLTTLIGVSTQSVKQDGNTFYGNGYTDDNLLRSVNNAPSKDASDVNGEYKYAAIFGRMNYNWQDKYIINLSARRDGSSKFGPGKQYGNFGATGLAWLFTNEKWAKKLSFLSFGKLRSSYGITGSDNIGNYQYLTNWSSGGNRPYMPGSSVYVPLFHANPNLQWEVNKKLETALDLGFIHDKINLEISWYQNRCGNQLVGLPLSDITGFNSVTANSPAQIQNTGLEFTFRAKAIENTNTDLSFNFNLGVNRNKLIAYPGLSESPYHSLYTIGKSLGTAKLLHFTGVDPATGQYTFEDKNHDGVINPRPNDTLNDLGLKDLSVRFFGGFGLDFRYKRFQVNAFFRFINQTIRSYISQLGVPGTISNTSTDIFKRWQKPGDQAEIARFTTQPAISYSYYTLSDAAYTDGSYIRLQNLSVSYDIPNKLLDAINMINCKLYLRGENLLLLTKYKGLDPDVTFGVLPPAKIITAGIQFNF